MNKNFFHKTQIKLSIESIYKDTISHPSSFVKKEILHKYYFDEKYKICADYDFFTKIYLKGIYSFHREDLPIAIFYFDGISSQNHNLTQAENEIIHKKYYSFFQRYRFDSKFRNEIQNRISHYKMILTHPRYIAGWIKRKIFK